MTRRHRTFGIALSFAFLCVYPSTERPAQASSESTVLSFDGRDEFYAGKYPEALAAFDQAVQADANDPTARYYRGVTRARLRQWDGAIADLRLVIEQNAALPQALLELGIAYVDFGRPAEAIPWLTRAQQVPELDATASFFLGLAQLRLGESAAALPNLERAAQSNELRVVAAYYEGLAWYQTREWESAEKSFAAVVAANPDSPMGRNAAGFLALIRKQNALYHLYADAGLEYDSNAVLAPSNSQEADALGITRQTDGRANFTAGGRLVPWRSGPAELSLGYEFFQGLYFDLSQLDVQDHRPEVALAMHSGTTEWGIVGRYDYYLADGNSFLQQGTVLPWVRVVEGALGRSELFYRFQRRGFLQSLLSTEFNGLDNAVGIRQTVDLGSADRYLWLGYRYNRDDAVHQEGNVFAYDANEVDAGVGMALPSLGIISHLGYRFRYEDFDPASGGRRDRVHAVTFEAQKTLTDHVALSCAYYGTFDDSNMSVFTYDRNIGSIGVEVMF